MQWFDRVVLGWIRDMMRTARESYGVDPVAFLVIYLVTVPFFYYSIFRMLRALARRRQQEIIVWSMVFLGATAAPFALVDLRGDRTADRAGSIFPGPEIAQEAVVKGGSHGREELGRHPSGPRP
jgi:hypothetical protein